MLYNNGQSKHNWIGLNLRGITTNPATGAIIRWSVDGAVHTRLKTAGGSYLSSCDPREIFGLGKAASADWLEIHGPEPSTRVDRFAAVPINRYLSLTEGQGIVLM